MHCYCPDRVELAMEARAEELAGFVNNEAIAGTTLGDYLRIDWVDWTRAKKVWDTAITLPIMFAIEDMQQTEMPEWLWEFAPNW